MLELGRLVATPRALELLESHQLSAMSFVARHAHGDYGDVCDGDRLANIHALHEGLRVLSKYCITSGDSIYVITEADRSTTCLLLCDEY